MDRPKVPKVTARKNPNGGVVYRIDFTDLATGKRVREVVSPNKEEARRLAVKKHEEQMAEWRGDPKKSIADINIPDLVGLFLERKKGRIAASSMRRYSALGCHVIEFFKKKFPRGLLADSVTTQYIEDLLAELSKEQQPKTINAERAFLRSVFSFAVDEGYCRDNPTKRVAKYLQANSGVGVKFWGKEQLKLIFDSVEPYWRDTFTFLYLTGIRRGELVNLTWSDVNCGGSDPTIIIQSKADWTTKNKRRRVLPISLEAAEIIKRQPIVEGVPYVFKAQRGGKINPDRLFDRLQTGLKHAGIDGNVHMFRHTFASHLIQSGISIVTVSELLGHSTLEMTMIYAHLAPNQLRFAVNSLSTAALALPSALPAQVVDVEKPENAV